MGNHDPYSDFRFERRAKWDDGQAVHARTVSPVGGIVQICTYCITHQGMFFQEFPQIFSALPAEGELQL
jgi:hypothetical protein